MAQFKSVNPKSLIAKQSIKMELTKDFSVYYVAGKNNVSFLTRGLTGDRVDLPLNGQIPELAIKRYFKQQGVI